MKLLAIIIGMLVLTGCKLNPFTGPSDCTIVQERFEFKQAVMIEGRLTFITVIQPEVKSCSNGN